jgi:hypothetical protein
MEINNLNQIEMALGNDYTPPTKFLCEIKILMRYAIDLNN